MKDVKAAIAACCVAMLGAAFAAPAIAQDNNTTDKTILTFSGPIQIPGRTLAAGTYVFRHADSISNRHIVQVFNEDGTDLIATILAIPDRRLEPKGKPVVNFAESAENEAPAIRSWFYPGDLIGDEFVYPKAQAMRIAKASNEPVLASEAGNTPEEMKGASVSRVTPNGEQTAYQDNTATGSSTASTASEPPPATPAAGTTAATTPTPSEDMIARERSSAAVPDRTAGTSGRAQDAGASAVARERLPKTASSMPAIALIGLLSLGVALGLRALAKTVA